MNQILYVKNKKINPFYRFQLYFSIIIIIVIVISFIIHKYNIYNKETISKELLYNYSISKLYSNSNSNYDCEFDFDSSSTSNLVSNYIKDLEFPAESTENIIGIIQIPKINISYPIFSNLTDELLKISPCRFYGEMPNKISNLCIAGHNYDNGKFFSNLYKLDIGDAIYIYDNNINKFQYIVTDIYEVEEIDWSPIKSKSLKNPTLTLITCNNKNKKRLIIKSNLQKNKK